MDGPVNGNSCEKYADLNTKQTLMILYPHVRAATITDTDAVHQLRCQPT